MKIQSARLVLLFASVLTAAFAHADPLGVGFPAFDQNASVLTSVELLPQFVRRAVTAPLAAAATESSSFGGAGVSDMMTVSSDYAIWSYRLRAGARFGNGTAVTPEDLVYSLKKCAKQGALPELSGVSPRTADEDIEHWIDIRIAQPGLENARNFPKMLAGCPILERKTSLVFGELLGNGSNLISTGPYEISTFIPGRKYILNRVRRDPRDRSGADELELRSFASPDQGLAALRVGTIVAFATTDDATIARGKNDETLAVEQCAGYAVVRRREAAMNCIENLSVIDIRENG